MNSRKIILVTYIDGIQVYIIENGDFFKSYEVEAKSKQGVGFLQTYKYEYQAFEIFNVICSVLKMKCN